MTSVRRAIVDRTAIAAPKDAVAVTAVHATDADQKVVDPKAVADVDLTMDPAIVVQKVAVRKGVVAVQRVAAKAAAPKVAVAP